MIVETLLLAFRAIRRNTLRSLLTVLGIIIGVAAVIAMVTLGSGTTAKVVADTAKLGTNLLTVFPGQLMRGPGRVSAAAAAFRAADVAAIREQVADLRAVAPVANQVAVAIVEGENWTTTVRGTDGDYLAVTDWELSAGRNFSESELRSGSAVCIVGETIREKLFGHADPVGKLVRIGRVPCTVIGLLADKGQGTFGLDQDDVVLLPIRTYQRRIAGGEEFDAIYVAGSDGASLGKIKREIEALLRERRGIDPGEEDDFTVQDMTELIGFMTSTTNVLTGLLGAVAAVSLLVGGIGIMNIMLVSVTERTREIGIRLAIGALRRQVLQQFLVEAVVLSLAGGVLGILLGLGLAAIGALWLGVPFVLNATVVIGAFVFSALVGILFGFFPARRAAGLDPIEALRHE